MAAKLVSGATLVLLLLSITCHRLHTAEGCGRNERRALLAIKSDMYDPGDWFSSWTGDDCCRWRGVACDNASTGGGHVTELDLRYPFPEDRDDIGASKVNPSLIELKHLKYLDLSMNDFDGASIPRTIASLVHLEYLNLSHAMFAGSIPPQLGNLSGLRFLDLGAVFEWPLSLRCDDLRWLSRIPSLKYLDMSKVNLSRATDWFHQINSIPTLQVLRLGAAELPSIPSPLPPFNLTSISRLHLSAHHNSYHGDSLLMWLSNGKTLEYLYLPLCFSNPSMEMIQLAVAVLSNLKELDLSSNSIHGEISELLRNASRRLEHLDLSDNSLKGELPTILGNLTQLRYLNFWSNMISGGIPSNVGNLVDLEFLDLSDNRVCGRIPRSMGNLKNLVSLDMSDNKIFGGIPRSFGDLYKLMQLDLSNNNISGQLPEALGKLKHLELLIISYNQLSGLIPRMVDLCNLSTLDLSYNNISGDLTNLLDGLLSGCPQGAQVGYLYLQGNNLSGELPSILGHLSQLVELDLSANSMQGDITEAHFSKLAKLDRLNISDNFMNIILPNDWLPPFSASTIDMSFCHMREKLPNWIRTQSQLMQLYLSRVGLLGELPIWFTDFISEGLLEELVLSSNNLSGPLPSATTRLMDLSNNSFVGPIPFSFMNSMETSVLSLSYNHISGSIPSSFCNLTSLYILDLSRNQLSGEIPSCHGSLPTYLQSLHLNSNNLSGRLPSFLAHCTDLAILDIGENKIYDGIPADLGRNLSALKVLRFSSNLLHGFIPVSLANLTSLRVLDLSFNQLRGSIPSSIGKLSSMIEIPNDTTFSRYGDCYVFRECHVVSQQHANIKGIYMETVTLTAKGSANDYTTVLYFLAGIDLSNNNLSGTIPEELTDLRALRFLSLSKNHLIGKIPRNIGAMKQLESLDLSFNDLEGEIPPSLSALHFLSHLNLSYNNLSGRIPTGRQLSTLNDPSSYAGNRLLCGFPLAECPRSDGLPREGEGEEEDDGRLEKVLEFAAAALGFVVGFWGWVGYLILKQRARFALFRRVDRTCDWVYVQLGIRFPKLSSICR